jgi:hypothetical protein
LPKANARPLKCRKTPATHRIPKKAPKVEDGERIDPPQPADGGAIRGARENLDMATSGKA